MQKTPKGRSLPAGVPWDVVQDAMGPQAPVILAGVLRVAVEIELVPVVVVPVGSRFVLIDGSLRVDVLRRLRRDTACATAWPLPEIDALIERHHLSARSRSRSRSIVEDGWLLQHPHREDRLGLDELAARFCRSKSWVSRHLALVETLGAPIHAKTTVRAAVVTARVKVTPLLRRPFALRFVPGP